jgi:ubiquinone/menaquinone biosynthesis C-methylase UbiE
MKINLGSGHKRIDGFLNIDADPNCNPDYLCNLEHDSIPLEDNTVDEVIVHHVLEHILNFKHVMTEIYRVCKPNAIIDIRLPHPNHDTFLIDPTHVRPLLPESFRLLDQEYNRSEIARGGASSTLGLMWNVNFRIAHVDYVIDSFYDQILPHLNEMEYVRVHREANNFCIETHTVLEVIK